MNVWKERRIKYIESKDGTGEEQDMSSISLPIQQV